MMIFERSTRSETYGKKNAETREEFPRALDFLHIPLAHGLFVTEFAAFPNGIFLVQEFPSLRTSQTDRAESL